MIEDAIQVLRGKLFKFYIFTDKLIALRTGAKVEYLSEEYKTKWFQDLSVCLVSFYLLR